MGVGVGVGVDATDTDGDGDREQTRDDKPRMSAAEQGNTTKKHAKSSAVGKKSRSAGRPVAYSAAELPGANLLSLQDELDWQGKMELSREYVVNVIVPHMPGVLAARRVSTC